MERTKTRDRQCHDGKPVPNYSTEETHVSMILVGSVSGGVAGPPRNWLLWIMKL